MDFGTLWALRNPFGRPFAELYRDTLLEIEAAEALGYESAWVTEHHFSVDGYLPSVMPALAAIAARTSRLRIGPYVLLMPLHHPIRLAEDAAVVDILSNGRLELAIGVGYRPEEFSAFSVDRARRGRLHDEGVRVLLQAWEDGPVQFSGECHQIDGVNVTPKPVQAGGPPLYLGGTSRPVLRRVAELGTHLAGRPRLRDYEFLLQQLEVHGRSVDDVEFLPFLFLWVVDDVQARDAVKPAVDFMLDMYREWFRPTSMTLFERPNEELCTIGSAQECVDAIERFLALGPPVPVRRLIVLPPMLGFDHALSMRHLELFAERVAPHYRDLTWPRTPERAEVLPQ